VSEDTYFKDSVCSALRFALNQVVLEGLLMKFLQRWPEHRALLNLVELLLEVRGFLRPFLRDVGLVVRGARYGLSQWLRAVSLSIRFVALDG
jgi:hypothetical protein